MRTYYVFFQYYQLINREGMKCSENLLVPWVPKYKLLPWKYAGCVIGTKALYEAFQSISFSVWNLCDFKCKWVNSFSYDPDDEYIGTGMRCRGIVVDDSGNIRDFYELTKKYHHYHFGIGRKPHKGYHYHCFTNSNEKKQRLTPQERQEWQETLNVPIPDIEPDRKARGWDEERFTTTGGSWKDQSKKQRQYGNKCIKLSKWIFYQEEENSSAYAEL